MFQEIGIIVFHWYSNSLNQLIHGLGCSSSSWFSSSESPFGCWFIGNCNLDMESKESSVQSFSILPFFSVHLSGGMLQCRFLIYEMVIILYLFLRITFTNVKLNEIISSVLQGGSLTLHSKTLLMSKGAQASWYGDYFRGRFFRSPSSYSIPWFGDLHCYLRSLGLVPG